MATRSRTIIAFLALLSSAFAFQDTVPVVAWASNPSENLDSLASQASSFPQLSHFLDALLEGDEVCRYDAVVIAEQPGLHASDLRVLPHSSYIPSRLRTAASSLQVPYLPHTEGDSFDHFKRSIVERCGARRIELSLGQGGIDFQQGGKHLVCVSMPGLESESNIERKAAVHENEVQLSSDIARVTSALPSHLVIYVGSSPFTKRQAVTRQTDPDTPTRPIVQSKMGRPSDAFAPINTTLPHGGLLERYQFFTSGLITALLVTFGLLVPLVMFGIHALASIQSPLRMDTLKGPSMEKKTQ